MTSSLRLWLAVVALLAGALLAACGGNGDDDDDGDTNGPAATEVVDGDDAEGTDGDADDGGAVDAGGEALEGVPLPEGADETGSGALTSAEVGFLVPGDDIDTEAFTTIDFRQYDVDTSPEDIIDFYRSELDDWDEVFVVSGGADGDEGGFGVWTRDDGRTALWISASPVDGATELIVIRGAQE